MADRIQQRRDTAARWAQFNPVLLEGEVGYVTDNPNQYKIGDGVHAWNELPLRGYDGTVVHTTGDSTTSVMSQKAVTDEFAKLRTAGYIYAGIATATTNPGTPVEKVFYVAITAGTYTNFGNKAVNNGITILSWNGTSWTSNELISIKSEVGSNENAVMSQKIVSNLLRGEADSITDNVRNPYTYLGSFKTWTEVQAELDKLHNTGGKDGTGQPDQTKVGEFRVQLDGRNLIVRNWVQNWATGVFTQTVEGSIKWNGETMEQSLQTNAYERTYNGGSGWGIWKSGESSGGNMILDWKTDAATTRKQVMQDERKAGMIISYKNASGEWINEQYVGTSFDDTSWAADANWQKIGVSAIELAQELSTEEGSEDRAISQKAVSEEINKINNGEDSNAEQIEIGELTDGLYLKNDGSTTSISGRAVSDFINIEQYAGKELTLLYGGTWNDSNSYCLYDADKRFVSRSTNKSRYLKFSVNENAKYIRISCPSSNIDKVQLWHVEVDRLGLAEMSKSLTNLESDLNSVLTVEKSFWGKEEKNFISNNSGSILSSNFFIKLQGRRYTKIKAYAKSSSLSFSVYALQKDINVFVPIYIETLSFSEEEIGTVVERSVDIEASMYDVVLFNCISGITYKQSSKIYPGVNLYNAKLSDILTKEELEDVSPFQGDNYLCDLSFSLLYKDVQGESSDVYLSEYFDKKDYVAYGDSITVTARNDDSVNDERATYPVRLANYFNLNLINKGVSGSTPVMSSNLSDANLSVVTSNTMLVTISGGQNGWVHSDDIDSSDRSTSVGAINYYIDKIREISPTCIIILCPTYIGTGNSQCAIDYKAISENKHVGLAPTLDLSIIDWEGDKAVKK